MTEYKSEFGKGMVLCLVKFAEHAERLGTTLEQYKKLREKPVNSGLFTKASAVSIWANGATDHLYEIEVPEGKDWDEIRVKVKEVQDTGLEMGHGMSNLMGCTRYTVKDAYRLIELTRDVALLIDKKLGLEPEMGEW